MEQQIKDQEIPTVYNPRIEQITFKDFRSYKSFYLSHLGCLTIFVGPNAIGKTNIIEGIQLVTACSSFRHATTKELLREGALSAYISTSIRSNKRALDISLEIKQGTCRYFLNQKKKQSADIKGIAPAVVFSPDDLLMIKRGNSYRRIAFDDIGSQLSAGYTQVKKDYERVLRQKNYLLKNESSPKLISATNELFKKIGAQFIAYRLSLVTRLIPLIKKYYSRFSCCEELVIDYIPSWSSYISDQCLLPCNRMSRDEATIYLDEALTRCQNEEYIRKKSLVGPHIDSIVFKLDGRDTAVFASQGQQRSLVLAFKLAECELITEMTGVKPILLLDDVMSELDQHRRIALTQVVCEGTQSFITTTHLSYFSPEILSRADVIELSS